MRYDYLIIVTTMALTGFFYRPSLAFADVLKTADNFAVLAGSTVTNTGGSSVTGDVGVDPGSAITGFPPGSITGTEYTAGGVTLQAQNDATTAYNVLAGMSSTDNETGVNLGGQTLMPGVYTFSSSAQLTGALVLNAEDFPNAVFVFQTGSTLITASNATVTLINPGPNDAVFWQVGSSATLGTGTAFIGNILAEDSITLNTGTSLDGRALALTDAVTLDDNDISNISGDSGSGVIVTPEPATLFLLGLGLLVLGRKSFGGNAL